MIYYINCILAPFKLVGLVVSSPQQAQHLAWQDQQQFQQQDGWATDRTLFKRKISFTFKAFNKNKWFQFEMKNKVLTPMKTEGIREFLFSK